MPVINCSRAGTTREGGECTSLTAHFISVLNGNDFCPVNGVNPGLTNISFSSIVSNHDFNELKFFRKIFFQKALKPKQKVAMLAPTSISSKLVKCSILYTDYIFVIY